MYKILIVDDEPWAREVVKQLVEWEKLQLEVVGEAEDGNQAIRLITELRPEIVITDMRMPGIDGVEFLKVINQQFPNIQVIVMSGYDDFIYLKQAIRSKAVEYLLKPINPDELNASLEQCVRELADKKKKSDLSFGIPPVFNEKTVLDRYLDFRRRISGYLLELNKSASIQTFKQLGEFLNGLFANETEESVAGKMYHDYILLLEEFCAREEFDFKRIWDNEKRKWTEINTWNSVPKAVEELGQLYGEVIDTIETFRKNKNRLDLGEVQAYIDRHYQEGVSLETLSQQFFISREHLSRVFKTFTGYNLSDYIFTKRMEKARELIAEQELSIKHVAEQLGYTDLAYFYRVFKKHFGITPGEMRKED